MKKQTRLALAIGSTLAATAALAPAAQATSSADSPFGFTALSAGYQLAQADAKQKDGKCGEAKCGANKQAGDKKPAEKQKEGSCGANKAGDKAAGDKQKDGNCGANKGK